MEHMITSLALESRESHHAQDIADEAAAAKRMQKEVYRRYVISVV